MDQLHVPVLAERVGELLAPALTGPDAVLVDATLGMGGHTIRLLQAHPELTVVGLDRDPEALRIAGDRIAAAGLADRAYLVQAVYDEIADVVSDLADRGRVGAPSVAGAFFDLGVSSLQLDRADRGFAYAQDAPLDMRMDPTVGVTAGELVNSYSAGELARVLREYGEERFAPRIAAAIVRRREKQPYASSAELVQTIREAIPAAARRTGGNPAKRTFQALRIEVNDELGALRRAIPAALSCLDVGGRIVVLSYHSLEDRIVKRALAALTVSTTPLDLPVELPGTGPELRLLVRGSAAPTESEIAENPRAASARLRAAERIRRAA
ncbi:16S rRNA (cytosine(1402)-N(4))-methyltransferase RsmH [Nakamurella aerolata]|uniref:16S rRNA (cytosine(1402)-N(4))-methyltransferase RsmH n=1 Tax=Nakamurella aerolata TaxID=1656892 RepID=UPI001BB0FF12|nr:16S rRNA (cytosine(1402)-N(4))-methyltransferase RsmH [Nakamurella aerolata]